MSTRELFYRTILVVGSLVFVLLACEAGARIYLLVSDPAVADLEAQLERSRRASPDRVFGRGSLMGLVQASADPEIVYELKPGLRGRFAGQRFEISSEGLRDREYPREKPAGTVRIAGLGDSVMFGWGVAQSEPYLEILERRLNEGPGAGPRFEVLNFAVPGYNTAIEAAVFERKALAFDPDLVVVEFVPNDLALPPFLQPPRRFGSLRRSFLLDLVRARLRGLPGIGESRLIRRDEVSSEDPGQIPERYRHMVGEEGLRRAMARLAALTRERSLPVIVILLQSSGEPWTFVRRVVEGEGFHPVVTGPYYLRYLAEHGIEPGRKGWGETFWVSARDSHPNALGHRLAAEAILEALRALGFGGLSQPGAESDAPGRRVEPSPNPPREVRIGGRIGEEDHR